MRDQFEKFPEISRLIEKRNMIFNEELNQYGAFGCPSDSGIVDAVGFVGGAWYAFQEQQKKIDAVLRFVDGYDSIDIENSVNLRDCVNEIKELLK